MKADQEEKKNAQEKQDDTSMVIDTTVSKPINPEDLTSG